MSANNFILIKEINRHKYEVSERCPDSGTPIEIGSFSTLREAVLTAQDYQLANEVEYGIEFRPC